MSDISIRLDGLLLGLVIITGGGIFVVTALLSTIRALTKLAGKCSWAITSCSLLLVLAHAAALLLLAVYIEIRESAPAGPDWIDWLTVLWSCLILAGLVLLFRQLRRENRRDAG